MSEQVILVEVSPRDGLQNERRQIATADKIALIDKLSVCGFSKIEVTSFVSSQRIPQLADAAEVMSGIKRADRVTYSVLVPNIWGFKGAVKAQADEIAVFTSASEGFCQKNICCSISESLERFVPVMEAARSKKTPVRGYVSCVTDCPYDGVINPSQVADVAGKLFELGCSEISLGDTIGFGTPKRVLSMLKAVLSAIPSQNLACHFHDTKGNALANIEISLETGIRCFDASVAGLGGCPYAPGSKGNVATESVFEMLYKRGFDTGIDYDRLQEAVRFARTLRAS